MTGLAMIGGSTGSNNANNCYIGLFSGSCPGVELDVAVPIPRAGTVSNFFFQSFGGGNSNVTIILLVNHLNSAITCTTDVDGNCSDQTHTVMVGFAQTVTVHILGNTTKPASWTAQFQ
jgi:hypothetical protein